MTPSTYVDWFLEHMHVVILLAGKGMRFANYSSLPKPMIMAKGKSILRHTTDSLPFFDQLDRKKLWFVVLKEHVESHQIDLWLREQYGDNINVLILPHVTRGNLETAQKVVETLLFTNPTAAHYPVLILDGDNAYDGSKIMDSFGEHIEKSYNHAIIYTFEPLNDDTHWCFAESNNILTIDGVFAWDHGRVIDLYEKPSSVLASYKPMIGVFYFSHASLFLNTALNVLKQGNTERNEFFMSQAMSLLLKQNIPVFSHLVTSVVPLGTPEDVNRFKGKGQRKHLRIAVDLDGTLCHTKLPGDAYGYEQPQDGAVETMRRWKTEGHYLIIHTARNMATYNGNIGLIIAKQVPIITEWLNKYGIPFDEIMVGKPHVDMFVDDAAFHHTNWTDTAAEVESLVARGGRFPN